MYKYLENSENKEKIKKLKEIKNEILENAFWTCSKHKECKTCHFFYYSCHGLDNASDPRIKKIPDNERWFIEHSWKNCDEDVKTYMFWLRFKDIGKIFDDMDKLRNLTENDIKRILKERNLK